MSAPQLTSQAPEPTRDVDAAGADLREHGVGVVLDVLDADLLAEVRTALYRAADCDSRRGQRHEYSYGRDDHVNQRVWNLPSRDPVFCDLAEHPLALHFVKATLGWPALLSSMSANITAQGGESMMVHCDQGYMPTPWTRPHGINIAWCVDDFTATNGATQYVSGSHRLNRNAGKGESPGPLVALEAPAGSMIAMEGRLWHTNGPSVDASRRAGIFAWYTLPIYLPQENWYLSANAAIRQSGSENLLTLLGFRPQVLGRINGRDYVDRAHEK